MFDIIPVCNPPPHNGEPYNIWGISGCVPRGRNADGKAYTTPCKEGYSSSDGNGTCDRCDKGYYNTNSQNMDSKIVIYDTQSEG